MTPNEKSEIVESLKSLNEKVKDKMLEFTDRLVAVEQGHVTKGGSFHSEHGNETVSDFILKSDNMKSMLAGNGKSCRIDLPAGLLAANKAAIVTDGQVLSPAMRVPGFVNNPLRMKRVRDLLPVGTTGNNMVEFTREVSFNNQAAPQYSSPAHENVTKPESGLTFELVEAPVRTLAHWTIASRQALADSAQLGAYVNNRLMEGLKVKEDLQLLAGDGTGGNLSGILNTGNFTAAPGVVSGENALDRILRTFAALAVDEMLPDGVLVHPNDWVELQLIKTTDGEYLLGSPGGSTAPSIWGVPVIASTAIDEGTFCVGSFAMGAQVWDRQQANVQISFEDGSNFVKNSATILVEERLALTVYRPKAFRKGEF